MTTIATLSGVRQFFTILRRISKIRKSILSLRHHISPQSQEPLHFPRSQNNLYEYEIEPTITNGLKVCRAEVRQGTRVRRTYHDEDKLIFDRLKKLTKMNSPNELSESDTLSIIIY